MKVLLTGWEVVIPPIAIYLVWRTLIRPWRREGRVPFDGLMIICFFFMWFWDPMSSATGHWFTYNAYLVNMGSWVNDTPGFLAFGQPGHMLPEPIILNGPIYMSGFMLGTVLGSMVMRKAKARWPHFGPGRLIGLCFLSMMVFDFIIEGCIWMPTGYYTYAGGHLSIWPNTYHKFPLHEMIFAGALWTGFACLRYFKNDRGETLAERGISNVQGGTGKKTLIRFLALLAAMSVVFELTFNVPISMFIANHSATWPKVVQDHSYFNDHICGAGTNRMCPGPDVPNFRSLRAPYLTQDGKLVTPANARLSAPVSADNNRNITVFDSTPLGFTHRTPLGSH
jgi:hypothetical protein